MPTMEKSDNTKETIVVSTLKHITPGPLYTLHSFPTIYLIIVLQTMILYETQWLYIVHMYNNMYFVVIGQSHIFNFGLYQINYFEPFTNLFSYIRKQAVQ